MPQVYKRYQGYPPSTPTAARSQGRKTAASGQFPCNCAPTHLKGNTCMRLLGPTGGSALGTAKPSLYALVIQAHCRRLATEYLRKGDLSAWYPINGPNANVTRVRSRSCYSTVLSRVVARSRRYTGSNLLPRPCYCDRRWEIPSTPWVLCKLGTGGPYALDCGRRISIRKTVQGSLLVCGQASVTYGTISSFSPLRNKTGTPVICCSVSSLGHIW
jgi:hypothetical protein